MAAPFYEWQFKDAYCGSRETSALGELQFFISKRLIRVSLFLFCITVQNGPNYSTS